METEGLLKQVQTDCEGRLFWRNHFGWRHVEFVFPTIVDYVREETRNREAVLFSLMSLMLMFFYGWVFNPPKTDIQCTQGSHTSPLAPSSLLFQWIYVCLWIAGMMGNAERYSHWLYHVGLLWCGWSCGCLSYAFAGCSLSLDIYDSRVLADTEFVMLLSVHYLAAYYWLIYYLPASYSRCLSPIHWLSSFIQYIHPAPRYYTPLQLQVAMLLGLWSLFSLFIQVGPMLRVCIRS